MDIDLVREDTVRDISVLRRPVKEKKLVEDKEYIQKVLKRIVDITGACIGILFLIPLTLGIAVAKLVTNDKGPIFYAQNRIGKDGKIFKMYKFRSMIVNADEKLEEYLNNNEEAREEYRINKKLKYDPRVTKVGKFIRKSSIDEFPQFINVIKGDMSLVGPRPYLPREQDDMGDYYSYIIAVKPGITGLWQVSGRNDVSFKKRLDLDLEYYEKRNLKLYFKILNETVKKVVFREGAM